MSETANKQDRYNLDLFETEFRRRYAVKKMVNAILCLAITFFGVTAVLYSVFVNHMNLFNRLRYMTFNATIFTSTVSFVYALLSIYEVAADTEINYRWAYFLRLSSAATELVIMVFVLAGMTPLFPDTPDISSYTGFMMHLAIPPTTVLSFLFNDAPIGRLKPLEPLLGTWFITIYVVVFFVLFGTGILPSEMAPYSFMDFEQAQPTYTLTIFMAIYALGYAVSLLLSRLNRRLSWLWFKDIARDMRQD